MFGRIFFRTLRPAAFIFAALLVATLATPALAMDGRTAVAICIDSTANGAHCAWSVNDKGEVDICNKSGCVYCPSATGECTAAKSRARPTRTLPVGATVKTPLGSVEVTASPFKGSILGARCLEGLRLCKNRCISRDQPCIQEQ
jgi:hypothetical protein